MADKPTEDILWAESAAGGDVTDPSGKRSAGYLFEDPWPHDEANYMFRAIGRFTNWLARSAGKFTDPQDAEGEVDAGETLISGGREVVGSKIPGATTTIGPTPSEALVDCQSDGYFVISLEQANFGALAEAQVHVVDPTGAVATRSWGTGDIGADHQALACNGEYIAVLRADGEFEVFDYDGVSQFTGDRVGTSSDICMDQLNVYIAGAAAIATGGTNSREMQAWTLSTGAFLWELDSAFGATLIACQTDGRFVYAASTSATGGGDYLVRVNLDGTIDAQGGAAGCADKGRLAIGRDAIYVASGTSPVTIYEYSKMRTAVFTQLSTVAWGSGAFAGALAVDDRYVYGVSNSILHAIPIDNMDSVWRGWQGQVAFSSTPWIVTTGQYVFVADDGASRMAQVSTGRLHGVWEYTGTTPYTGHWFQRRYIPGD